MQLNTKNLFALSLLIIALSFAYYFVIFLPNKEKTKQGLEWKIKAADLEHKQSSKLSLESCLEEARDHYRAIWDFNCKEFGEDKKEAGCAIRGLISDKLRQDYQKEQELCVEKYK